MNEKGHDFFVTARDKDCNIELLNAYKFNYVIRGKGSSSLVGKFFYFLKAVNQLYRIAKKYKPDLFISFCSPYAAQVSRLYGKPHIAFTDTEHSRLLRMSYLPNTDYILSPSCYQQNLGRKHFTFEGYKELAYLHKNYFTPDKDILDILGIKEGDHYAIVRFISWKALHDMGHKGLSLYDKIRIVQTLTKYLKVFISSEEELPEEIKRYRINLAPEKIHDALAFADLFVGEGASMVSECAVLGIPAIYNYLQFGYLKEQEEKYQLIFKLHKIDDIIEKSKQLILDPATVQKWQERRKKMLAEKIDVTDYMVNFVDAYPKSVEVLSASQR
jgi:uncharacterized protein